MTSTDALELELTDEDLAELDALGARLRVTDLEALDGTPVVDVKPVLRSIGER
jgi:tRNA (Thr-GGU) A37 N-methylase